MVDTGQGLIGTNMFAYCENNPVMFLDPAGTAMRPWSGDTVISYWSSKGFAYQYTNANGDYFKNKAGVTKFIPKPKPTPVTTNRGTGNGSSANQNSLPNVRNVTPEVNKALKTASAKAQTKRTLINLVIVPAARAINEYALYREFYNLVKKDATWDIKNEEGTSWDTAIGTDYPGKGAIVLYSGKLMSLEALGNYTYGYLGAAYGIPYPMLLGGSYYAAGFPTGSDLQHEISDWVFVRMGYNNY